MQRRMVNASKSSAQANLFQGPIRGLPVLLPPLEMQIRFETLVSRMASLGRRFDKASMEVNALMASLQNSHFHHGARAA